MKLSEEYTLSDFYISVEKNHIEAQNATLVFAFA